MKTMKILLLVGTFFLKVSLHSFLYIYCVRVSIITIVVAVAFIANFGGYTEVLRAFNVLQSSTAILFQFP